MGIIWDQGVQQQTPAVQLLFRQTTRGVRRATSKRRRGAASASGAKRSKKASGARRSVKRASGKAAKFVKGSAAAKAHMAKLRKMVGKRK